SIKHQDKYSSVNSDIKVALIKAHVGLDETFFNAIIESGYDGLIIEALGQGNLPPSAMDGLDAVTAADITTVIDSRSFNGIVASYYDYHVGRYELKKKGIIFSNGLNETKSRLKFMLSLNNLEKEEMRYVFES